MDSFRGYATNALQKALLRSPIHDVSIYEQIVGETLLNLNLIMQVLNASMWVKTYHADSVS